MKKFLLMMFFVVSAVILCGCYKPYDKRVNVEAGVRSDTIENNMLTRPFIGAYSLLAGEGIDIKDIKSKRNDAGIMEIQVSGYNRSVTIRRFEYRVEWLDSEGVLIDAQETAWLPVSVKAKSDFSFNAVAPTKDAIDFKINTRKVKG